jgi:CBS domain-containing protein
MEAGMRLKSATLRDVARRAVVTVAADTSLAECAQVMRREHVGALIVVEQRDGGARPIGVVTDRDIVVEAVAVALDPAAITAGDVMSRPPATVHEDDDLLDALARKREQGVRRLPVLDRGERLVGIVSVDDLVEGLVEVMDAVAGVMRAEQAKEMTTRP